MWPGMGSATRVYLAVEPVDMRKGFEGLSGAVRAVLEEDPLSGHLFVFCNRDRSRLKVLCWDGSGLWVCAKRLAKGRYSWPRAQEAQRTGGGGLKVCLRPEELAMLLGGMDPGNTRRKNWWRTAA
jgi:transposase